MDAKLEHWRAAMADLMLGCAAAEADQAAALVTALAALLRAAPSGAALVSAPQALPPIVSEADADAAALVLAAGLGGYLLSQGRGGPAMATVVLGDDTAESHGEGPCPGIALVGAIAAAFAAEPGAPRAAAAGHSRSVSLN